MSETGLAGDVTPAAVFQGPEGLCRRGAFVGGHLGDGRPITQEVLRALARRFDHPLPVRGLLRPRPTTRIRNRLPG